IVPALLGVVLTSALVVADSFTFEAPTYNASAAGTILTGPGGWYIPAAGGVDGKVYTYTGNTLGINALASGGSQFLAATKAPINFSRAQHDGMWGDGLTGCRRVCFDVNGTFFVGPDSDPN